jgi:selenocysteine-specific elongation factor
MPTRHFIVATAGHVDHGKSALVQALTGTDPDRLPEEKARGITIDLGFAHLRLPAPGNSGEVFDIGLIDVPGHEDFVQNMVTGAGAVNVALFVVAADDLWMPQTEEHLQILTYLGVRHAVVVLTKIDLAADEPRAGSEIRRHLRNSPFENAPIVAASVPAGRGIEEVKNALANVLGAAPPPRDIGKPRLPVDRVFALRGIGTVVTGTLTGGVLRRGDRLAVQPSGRQGSVRGLQSHHQEVEFSGPGARTALNLPDFPASGAGAIQRGDVLTAPEAGEPSRVLDVLLERSSRGSEIGGGGRAASLLKTGARVRLHLGSGHWNARLTLLDAGQLAPGEHAIGRLRADAPVFAFAGDRFIIRDGAERITLAGGVVLDPDGRRPLRRPAQRRFLLAQAVATHDCLAAAGAVIVRDRALRRDALLAKSNFGRHEIEAAMARLIDKRVAVAAGEFIADAAWWLAARGKAAETINGHHREHPEKLGLPLADLRTGMARELPFPELFEPLLADLTCNGYIQTAATVRRLTHEPALPAAFREAGARIRATLKSQPLQPPSRGELAPDRASQQALLFLRDTGEIIELNPEVFLPAETFLRTQAAILRFIRSTGPATASDLRQMLGTTRRVLIPLLERLDRDGLTRREGDRRVLREEFGLK